MLDIETFDNLRGGNVVYKALAHPLAAEALARLAERLNAAGPTAIYDPDGIAGPLLALSPEIDVEGVYVHDTLAVGQVRGGHIARPLTALADAKVTSVLVAGFDAGKRVARIASLRPGVEIRSLDSAKLPERLVTSAKKYLDAVNFATNFVFFRDDGRLGTRLTTVNYWAGYGASNVRFFLRLYDAAGAVLAQWEQAAPDQAGGFVLDSGEIRARFGLPSFTGQLFVHAIGVAGHDVVKYALDTFATDNGASLSCTHDANAWPSERFAGLPAPDAGERVVVWLQNSHAVPIPAGAMAIGGMGGQAPVGIDVTIPPFATLPLDVAEVLPGLRWPAQIELFAGRHVVRPRYEVTLAERTRIAHVNVERDDLQPDAAITNFPAALGRGFLLPFPILPRPKFRTLVQPTPMATSEQNMPLRLDVFSTQGEPVVQHYLGVLPRDHHFALDLDEVPGIEGLVEGHAELVYDFREGGKANGWLHALFRYQDRASGHVAESSFGAHIFNTLMTYKNEPQSYNGPPPGLSTRLFLKLGFAGRDSFCVLIYPASAKWHPYSSTVLELYDATGALVATRDLKIACSGSATIYPADIFGTALLAAGATGYILIRDATCRLFGFHGTQDHAGGFSLDHMFGF
jgi:hypothetical protein